MKIFVLISSILFLQANNSRAQLSCCKYDTSLYVFFDSTKNFNAIEDILKLPQFSGKVVYIDLWGYGCSICMRQFTYLPSIKKLYKNANIAYLYIYYKSRDKELDYIISDYWIKYSVKHNLTGIHVLAFIIPPQTINNGHIIELREMKPGDAIYLDSTEYALPTYMLANKFGKIVNFKAPRPSQKGELIKKLDILLKE